MVKHYYIQDYPENLEGNTKAVAMASIFFWPVMKRSLTSQRGKRKTAHNIIIIIIIIISLFKFCLKIHKIYNCTKLKATIKIAGSTHTE